MAARPPPPDKSAEELPRIVVAWLIGTVVLLPFDLITLPLNMDIVDVWILLGMPFVWLGLVRGRHVMSWAYAVPFGLVLLGSLASTFAAPVPRNSLVVVVKEAYLYAWLVTLTVLLVRLQGRDLRRLLGVWIWVVVAHGAVILAQFAFPTLWRVTAEFAGRTEIYEVYRPTGLFVNANSAAFFQLLGFVPLVLWFRSHVPAMAVAAFVLCTMAVTGSMAATVAFMVGTGVALSAVALSGYAAVSLKTIARALVGAIVLGTVLVVVVGQVDRYREHLEQILVGRTERSAESRFDLWSRGFEVLVDHGAYAWGVGPENFRVVDGEDKQLHNDLLAFLVERGLVGALGLVLFIAVALVRAHHVLMVHTRCAGREGAVTVVFLAALVAAMVESITHQSFHVRELWLILALQEALLFGATATLHRAPESVLFWRVAVPVRPPAATGQHPR